MKNQGVEVPTEMVYCKAFEKTKDMSSIVEDINSFLEGRIIMGISDTDRVIFLTTRKKPSKLAVVQGGLTK